MLESPGAGVLSGCEESKVGWEPKLRFSARTANACICWKNQALESQPFYVMIPLAIKEPMFIQEWSRVCIISFLERKTALLSGSHFACLAKRFCNCGWSSVSVLHTAGLRLTAAFQLPSQAVGPSFCFLPSCLSLGPAVAQCVFPPEILTSLHTFLTKSHLFLRIQPTVTTRFEGSV